MTWDTSRKDWAERIKAGQSLLPDVPLIKAQADKGLAIFEMLRLPDVTNKPRLKDAAGEWQRDIVRGLFGSYDAKANTRHIREVFALVPKKSSKTTAGAGIMLTAMLMSKRPRAEFLIIAPTLEIADLAFRQAVGMVEADPVLSAKCQIQEHIKRIIYKPTGSFLKVKSFDPKVVTGSKPAGVLIDELHVIADSPQADRVIGQLRGGLISQPEGFMVTITTQSERPPSGVFKAELQKARAVRDGRLQAPVLPILYEFPDGVDWRDTSKWWMVTPNRGLSVTVERLIPDYNAAIEGGEEELRRWASQHLNVEIGLALRSDRWAGADFWEAQGRDSITLEAMFERCDVIEVGIDGGGLDDLLGLAVMGRDRETNEWMLWSKAWAHPSVMERRKSEFARFMDFARDGDLILVENIGEDAEQVADIILQCEQSGLLDKVGVDPYGLGGILDALAQAGVPAEKVIGISQGWKLGGAIKTAERKLADGGLIHQGSPMMAWCVGNCRVEPRSNAILITKQASGTAKIDPCMAMFNAVSLLAINPSGGGKSFWLDTEAATV